MAYATMNRIKDHKKVCRKWLPNNCCYYTSCIGIRKVLAVADDKEFKRLRPAEIYFLLYELVKNKTFFQKAS